MHFRHISATNTAQKPKTTFRLGGGAGPPGLPWLRPWFFGIIFWVCENVTTLLNFGVYQM